jgi:DNA-directed RNA polymerase subunit K/omega
MSIQTQDIEKFESRAKNIYEALVVVSKRARQINDETKIELNQRLEPIIAKETEDDTIMNQDKLDLSLEFEARAKPSLQSIKELMNDELDYRFKSEDEEE